MTNEQTKQNISSRYQYQFK